MHPLPRSASSGLARLAPTFPWPVEGLKKGFDYLEDRLTGNCQAHFDCSASYRVLELARAFDPAKAIELNLAAWVDSLVEIVPINSWDLLPSMKAELTTYLAAAQGATFNREDIDVYTEEVLAWWRNNSHDFPTWAKAARMIFAMTPNSAMCERVFSLLEAMFGKERNSSLSDMLQGSLMLRYNKSLLWLNTDYSTFGPVLSLWRCVKTEVAN